MLSLLMFLAFNSHNPVEKVEVIVGCRYLEGAIITRKMSVRDIKNMPVMNDKEFIYRRVLKYAYRYKVSVNVVTLRCDFFNPSDG